MKTIREIIERQYNEIYGATWTGFLYRSSDRPGGIFYHTDPDGARFYGRSIGVYECPGIVGLLLDTESLNDRPVLINGEMVIGIPYIGKLLNIDDHEIYNDWVLSVEQALPYIFKDYGALVISGETGKWVEGTSVEVALVTPPRALATI